jgi:hypothetical protein
MRDLVIKRVWDKMFEGTDQHLLFGSRTSLADLSSFHPNPVQIFRLWQVYLDNVNPIFKVTHTPTLQVRIIEAASNLTNIDPKLEALMFSIYCISIRSLDPEESRTMFGSTQEELLTQYQVGCQQALMNCNFLKMEDRECLTALFLYLVKIVQRQMFTINSFRSL